MISKGVDDSRIPLQGLLTLTEVLMEWVRFCRFLFGKRSNTEMSYTISLDISFNWRDLI